MAGLFKKNGRARRIPEKLAQYDDEYLLYCVEKDRVETVLESTLHETDDPKEIMLLSSKIGPVLANNFPPQLLKNLFSVSEAPALIIKVQYLALMRQPVQQSCCEDSVAKKLRPAIKAFI